jgi:hypothetical protein
MSSSPSGTGANDVAPKPGLARRAVGWLLIVVSPVPAAFPFVITFLLWDQVPRPPFPPSWAIPFFLMSYLACTVALLWLGKGLMTGRDNLVWNGILLFFGALMAYVTVFSIVD